MALRFLLDEQVEPDVAEALDAAGHEAVHVRHVSALGRGSDDAEVAAYSKRVGRYVLTNDDDFFQEIDDDLPTLFYFPNQRLEAHRIAEIIGVVDEQFTTAELDAQPFVRVVEDWL